MAEKTETDPDLFVKPDHVLVNTGICFGKSHGQRWCRVAESDLSIGEYVTVRTDAGVLLVLCELLETWGSNFGGFENKPIRQSELETVSILMSPV